MKVNKDVFVGVGIAGAIIGIICIRCKSTQNKLKKNLTKLSKLVKSGKLGRQDVKELEKLFKFKEVRMAIGYYDFKSVPDTFQNIIPSKLIIQLLDELTIRDELRKTAMKV